MSKRFVLNKAAKRATMGLMGLSLAGLLVSCNSHPVSFAQSEGAVVVTEDRSPDSAASVDILWMIDNSGSMCEIQTSIRENFERFIDQIAAQNIDFQLGVTTTHMDSSNATEPLSRPGYLQAYPQPVPTSIGRCSGDAGDPGDPMDGYEPVRTNIELAIQCSKDGEDKWGDLRNVTDQEIFQAYEAFQAYKLFPTTPSGQEPFYDTPEADNPYRTIKGDNKLVLHSEDYRDATGQLDVDSMRADFACMSLVGTTGTGAEKGLAAAVHALSPEMTGGTVEAPLENAAEAPNHGLLRENANFALVMVTDENDCSDYGLFAGEGALPDTTPFYDEAGNPIERAVSKAVSSPDVVCAMWNDPALVETTPLISTEALAQRLKENLSSSKGKEVNEKAIVVTSIHGDYRRYGEDYPTDSDIEAAIAAAHEDDRATIRATIEAAKQDPNQLIVQVRNPPYDVLQKKSSCTISGDSGDSPAEAFSGDRYESFLRHFSPDRVLPAIPPSEDEHMLGLICDAASMGVTLGQIGELIAGSTAQCITEPPFECQVDEDCPAFNFDGQAPTCRSFGRSSRKYCDSGLQLRLYPAKDGEGKTFADLQSHPYCVAESINSSVTPGGCLIDRSHYRVEQCAAVDAGINIEWVDEDSFNILAGYDVELVYAVVPEPEAAE
ncbi:hypothetical protein [Bradymonas sediminis]|nr:hypothetical protein [Bradymonas sediminis]TDP73889.1 hypothetical protein DFR33_105223 [Bradymonas sediminis]